MSCLVKASKSANSTASPGFAADLGTSTGAEPNAFRGELQIDPALRDANCVLANPPLNNSVWFRKNADERWEFGVAFALKPAS